MLMAEKHLPKKIIIEMVKMAINYIRGLPKVRNNIYQTQSPRQLVTWGAAILTVMSNETIW